MAGEKVPALDDNEARMLAAASRGEALHHGDAVVLLTSIGILRNTVRAERAARAKAEALAKAERAYRVAADVYAAALDDAIAAMSNHDPRSEQSTKALVDARAAKVAAASRLAAARDALIAAGGVP